MRRRHTSILKNPLTKKEIGETDKTARSKGIFWNHSVRSAQSRADSTHVEEELHFVEEESDVMVGILDSANGQNDSFEGPSVEANDSLSNGRLKTRAERGDGLDISGNFETVDDWSNQIRNNNRSFSRAMLKDSVSRRASLEMKVNTMSMSSLDDMGNVCDGQDKHRRINSRVKKEDGLDMSGNFETFDDEIDLKVRKSFGRAMLKDSISRRASLEMKVNRADSMSSLDDMGNVSDEQDQSRLIESRVRRIDGLDIRKC